VFGDRGFERGFLPGPRSRSSVKWASTGQSGPHAGGLQLSPPGTRSSYADRLRLGTPIEIWWKRRRAGFLRIGGSTPLFRSENTQRCQVREGPPRTAPIYPSSQATGNVAAPLGSPLSRAASLEAAERSVWRLRPWWSDSRKGGLLRTRCGSYAHAIREEEASYLDPVPGIA
jgi:hypothetical protein